MIGFVTLLILVGILFIGIGVLFVMLWKNLNKKVYVGFPLFILWLLMFVSCMGISMTRTSAYIEKSKE